MPLVRQLLVQGQAAHTDTSHKHEHMHWPDMHLHLQKHSSHHVINNKNCCGRAETAVSMADEMPCQGRGVCSRSIIPVSDCHLVAIAAERYQQITHKNDKSDLVGIRDVQQLLQLLSYAHLQRLICGCFAPQLNAVLALPDVHSHAADLSGRAAKEQEQNRSSASSSSPSK